MVIVFHKKAILFYSYSVKTSCCPPTSRKGNHTHLKHLPDIRTCWPSSIDYIKSSDDIEIVIERHGNEGRRLDQINGGSGSLAETIGKELYGDENQRCSRYICN